MSLSKKIAAALDENTKAYVLPCSVTVEESPNRLTLHITAFDTVGLACTALEFVTTAVLNGPRNRSRNGARGWPAE